MKQMLVIFAVMLFFTGCMYTEENEDGEVVERNALKEYINNPKDKANAAADGINEQTRRMQRAASDMEDWKSDTEDW